METRPLSMAGCHQLTVASPNQPGLFAAITGALALHGLDVHAAEIFTLTDNTVLAIFTVSTPPDLLQPAETFARVGRSIHYALNGKLALGYRLDELRNSPLIRHRTPTGKSPEILVDNTSSDFHTTLTIRADDRIGFLFDVAETLSTMCIQVHLAKIGANVDRVEDVFFVRTDLGEKIIEKDQIRELKRALLHTLNAKG